MIQMSRNISLWVISFLTVFALMVPASANVWRSSTGNIFRFQEDGSMTILRANGSADAGRWWWTNYGYSGQFVIFGDPDTYTVFISPYNSTAEVRWRNNVSFWNYFGSRGEKADTTSETGWFMAVPATLRPLKAD